MADAEWWRYRPLVPVSSDELWVDRGGYGVDCAIQRN